MNEVLESLIANWEIYGAVAFAFILSVKSIKKTIEAIGKVLVSLFTDKAEELKNTSLEDAVGFLMEKAKIDLEANITNPAVNEQLTDMYKEIQSKL